MTFLLLVAGAMVTSNQAGLSVPDWPTSFGSLYKMPPMAGGVKFEHGHRMFAEFVGLLTLIAAVWTLLADGRAWLRMLGFIAVATVVAQGILGGITVLMYLPWAVSTAHAALAQAFFCVIVVMAMATSRAWAAGARPQIATDDGRPSLTTLAFLAVGLIYLQLILGAAFRHFGMKLLPHLITAGLVTAVVVWISVRMSSPGLRNFPALRSPARTMLGLLVFQLALGFASYFTRVRWADSPQPLTAAIISTVTHVVVGALLLACALAFAIQCKRRLSATPGLARSGPVRQAVSA